jgi:magnesium chelatase subunit D
LLAAADGGVLYVDEINLLPDHLVDVLLDVAASGINRVEREGISHVHSSRFLLIGSMNPEEGDLRPQLLDRFGLAVDVRASTDPVERAAAVRGRLAFDADPGRAAAAMAGAEADLTGRLAAARPADLPDEMVEAITALCTAVGAEGLRADLTICRAAAALAGWEGRPSVTAPDVRRVAPLALAHRARRDPLEPAGMDQERLAEALAEHLEEEDEVDDDDVAGGGEAGGGPRPPVTPGPATLTPLPGGGAADRRQTAPASGRRVPTEAQRGRLVGDRAPDGPIGSVAVGATVRRAAARVAAGPGEPLVRPDDLRQAVRVQRSASLIVLAVDASGSMGAPQRMEAAKGAVLGLLTDAYQHRDLVALVAFRGDDATVLLRPTGSVEVAQARLAELPTGGRTPLAAGLSTALGVATAPGRAATHRPLLVLITDGRATAGPPGIDPVSAAVAAAAQARRAGVDSVVIDVEDTGPSAGPPRLGLGLARQLADHMGARHLRLAELTSAGVQHAVRAALR